MTTASCPTCHQPLREPRAGVWLPPLKARIFDAVKASGDVGISSRELWRCVYHDRRPPKTIATVRLHILQMNDLLSMSDVTIRTYAHRWFLHRRAQVRT